MIKYHQHPGPLSFFRQLFQRAGSVFPSAFKIAVPSAAITTAFRIWIDYGEIRWLQDEDSVLKDNAAWGGFSFLVGFLVVFRTSQSYNRFWDGCTSTHRMRAEWFDGCSALLAFCKHSKADLAEIKRFQNTLVRLFSMLHAAALAEIEDCESEDMSDYQAFKFPIIDPEGMDEESILSIKASSAKVELIFQWIQQLIVENINTGVLSIPPPILSRSFQEIANGMVAFHDAIKISYIPFPFPYAQTCDFLLVLHWLVVPFVVSQWVTKPLWAAVFSFVQVLFLWALNFIAVELENPFGSDANDIDDGHMQAEMNQHLVLLMAPSTRITPTLSHKAKDLSDHEFWKRGRDNRMMSAVFAPKSFSDVWNDIANAPPIDCESAMIASAPPSRRTYCRTKTGAVDFQAVKSNNTSSNRSTSQVAPWQPSPSLASVTAGRPPGVHSGGLQASSAKAAGDLVSVPGSREQVALPLHQLLPTAVAEPTHQSAGYDQRRGVVSQQPSSDATLGPLRKVIDPNLELKEAPDKPAPLKPPDLEMKETPDKPAPPVHDAKKADEPDDTTFKWQDGRGSFFFTIEDGAMPPETAPGTNRRTPGDTGQPKCSPANATMPASTPANGSANAAIRDIS